MQGRANIVKFRNNSLIKNTSLMPLYRQVEDLIRQDIASGRFKEGDLIPSEPELAREYGVSHGTVRKAILNMSQQGIFYRRQGKGTFLVFEQAIRGRSQNFRFLEGPTADFAKVKLTFLNFRIIPAEGNLVDYLQVKKGEKIIRLERSGKITEKFLIHTVSFLPKRLYRGLENYTAKDFHKNTLWKLQEIYFGIRIEKREEFISAVAADADMAKMLEVSPGNPILRIKLKLTSFGKDIAEYRVSHCNSDTMQFYVGYKGI